MGQQYALTCRTSRIHFLNSDQTLCRNSSTPSEWRSREISIPPLPGELLIFNLWPKAPYGRVDQCGYVEMVTKLVNQRMGAPIQVYNSPDENVELLDSNLCIYE